MEDGNERIVLDLSGLASLDSAAVSTLLIAALRATDDHRQLVLIRGSEAVQQAIDRVQGPFCYIPEPQHATG